MSKRSACHAGIRAGIAAALVLFPVVVFAQADWTLAPQSQALRYRSEVRREGCQSAPCVVLMPPATVAAEPGSLVRRLDAAPYRSSPVRLRAAVRLENPGPGDRAQLWMRVVRTGRELGFYDDMGDRPITSPEWKTYEIDGEVAPDAESIEIGLRLTGRARAWVDTAVFEKAPATADAAMRDALHKAYSRIDAAYAAGDVDAIAAFALPDAQVAIGGERTPLSAVLRQVAGEIRNGAKYQSHSNVTAVRGGAPEATVAVNNQTTITSPTASQTVLSASRDTWVETTAGWRLKESVLIAAHLATPSTGPEAARPVVSELKQRAIALPAGIPTVAAVAGAARIVALGQASYGTREFGELNRRIIEYLVEQKGFTVVAIGANWAEARATDRYIHGGGGDPRSAIENLNAWPWETGEMLELVRWLRDWNAAPGRRPVHFAGFDIQPSAAAARIVIDYLKEYAPEEAGPAELAYAEVRDAERAAAAAAGVARMLDTHHRVLVTASSDELWREARQAAAVAYQSRTMQIQGKGRTYRAEATAGNIEWLAAEAHPNEKIVVWAHDADVAVAPGTMAAWLRRRYGTELYTVGYAFRGGEVRVAENGELVVRTAAPSPDGSGDAVLSAAGLPECFLDLHSVPAGSALGRWLEQPHLFHRIGVFWNPELTPETPAKLYDGLAFVEQSHPAEGM